MPHALFISRFAFLLALHATLATALRGQDAGSLPQGEIFVGSELENYLRYVTVRTGRGAASWSIREFSQVELQQMQPGLDHPWVRHLQSNTLLSLGTASVQLIAPRWGFTENTSLPFGSNDGAVWKGRGVTSWISGGMRAQAGPVVLTIMPVAFWAQNQQFDVIPTGYTGPQQFADYGNPTTVDRPQRFGDGALTVVDPGQSSLRVDFPAFTLGVSTANQAWGPAHTFPFLLSANAPGFPHVFLGTGRSLNLGPVALNGRLVYGKLEQSAYAFVPESLYFPRRFMSGVVATIEPKVLTGLEVGAARFFHTPWHDGGPTAADLRKPFETFSKRTLISIGRDLAGQGGEDNQLASVFGRWAFPRGGFEIYAEAGREDHGYNIRDVLLEPDHTGTRLYGFRKTTRIDSTGFVAVRGEFMNAQATRMAAVRAEGTSFLGSVLRQGHTEKGQLLGADIGPGDGAAHLLATDVYRPWGRTSFWYQRKARGRLDGFRFDGIVRPTDNESQHAIGVEMLRFAGDFDISGSVGYMKDFNRGFVADASNFTVELGARWQRKKWPPGQ